MALKAGLVGVNPKGVDKNGMPIASDGNGVKETQLTANGKKFFFAYDETSEKYGYKLDGAGDFIPFESAGGGPGWVKPAELISEGVSANAGTIEDGGYYVDGDICYVDVLFKSSNSSSSSRYVKMPLMPDSATYNFMILRGNSVDVFDEYMGSISEVSSSTSSGDFRISVSANANAYVHLFGSYKIATA